MRLFKTFEAQTNAMEKSQHERARGSERKKTRAPKPQVSAAEIREKVQEHFKPKVEVDRADLSKIAQAKNQVSKPAQDKPEPELTRPSDVGLNDPQDPATIGKLKDILSKGAFNFNPREREALEKILADKD